MKPKAPKSMYRQGDVLLIPVATIPAKAKARADKQFVLAYGEATGHAHTVEMTDAQVVDAFLADLDQETFLAVPKGAAVVHQEHDTVTLPPGRYKVLRQQEYHPEAIRRVQD